MLAGKILLTGSGFLARGILRRAAHENWSNEIIVYSRSAASQALCKRKYPGAHYVTGDIRDIDRLRLVMLGVNTVIHTAAFKYVPEAEINVGECVSVNVEGTKSVLVASHECNVSHMVIISTDKAVLPVNVYGMTKAIGERLMAEMSALSITDTKFTGVRYGNVIGSTGSIVPELEAQARTQGFVQVTNPKMTRFWITIDNAIALIFRVVDDDIQQGSILVPVPQSMELGDLVDAVIPNGCSVRIVGERPGEKLHESLLTESESLWTIYDEQGYELPSLHNRHVAPHLKGFTLNSFDADRMSVDDFLAAVEDAKNV